MAFRPICMIHKDVCFLSEYFSSLLFSGRFFTDSVAPFVPPSPTQHSLGLAQCSVSGDMCALGQVVYSLGGRVMIRLTVTSQRASQVVLVLKNPPANAGNTDSIPGSRRTPGGGNGNPLHLA